MASHSVPAASTSAIRPPVKCPNHPGSTHPKNGSELNRCAVFSLRCGMLVRGKPAIVRIRQAAGQLRYHQFGMVATLNRRRRRTVFVALRRCHGIGERSTLAALGHRFAAPSPPEGSQNRQIPRRQRRSAKTFPWLYDQCPISNRPAKAPPSICRAGFIPASRSRLTDDSRRGSSVWLRRQRRPKQNPLKSRPHPAV
jgi:hypothetical protein